MCDNFCPMFNRSHFISITVSSIKFYLDQVQTFKIINGHDNVKCETWFKLVGQNVHHMTRASVITRTLKEPEPIQRSEDSSSQTAWFHYGMRCQNIGIDNSTNLQEKTRRYKYDVSGSVWRSRDKQSARTNHRSARTSTTSTL